MHINKLAVVIPAAYLLTVPERLDVICSVGCEYLGKFSLLILLHVKSDRHKFGLCFDCFSVEAAPACLWVWAGSLVFLHCWLPFWPVVFFLVLFIFSLIYCMLRYV